MPASLFSLYRFSLPKQLHPGLAWLWCLLATLYASNLWAVDNHVGSQSSLDFSLQLSRDRFCLKSPDASVATRQNRIGVVVYSTENRYLQYGLMTGASYLTLDNALSKGRELKGFHFGLALRNQFGHQPLITTQAYYLYQEAKHEESNRTMQLNNYEWGAQAAVQFVLGQYAWLTLGAMYHESDAEQRVSGDIQASENLRLPQKTSAYLTLEMPSLPDGRIGFSLRRGGLDGVSLNFSRNF